MGFVAQDFDAAKDATIDCVWSVVHARVNIVSYWNECRRQQPTSDQSDISAAVFYPLDQFQKKTAAVYAKLALADQRTDSLLSRELLDAVTLGSAHRGRLPADLHGRQFPTWHQAAAEMLREFLAIPVLAAPPLDDVFDPLLTNGQWVQELGKILATAKGPHRMSYWQQVVDRVKTYRGMDPEQAEAQIKLEWANAKSQLSADVAPEVRGQGDTKRDKKKRPLNDEARACIRSFLRKRESDPNLEMAPHCRQYAEENASSAGSLYRTIKDHPEKWKPKPKGDTKRDKPV